MYPSRGKAKILAKIGNSVVEPLLKSVRIAEEMREIEKSIAGRICSSRFCHASQGLCETKSENTSALLPLFVRILALPQQL
jgi:hypothetical protein